MSWRDVGILAAGFAAGGMNAAVGSGTLITFPVLIGFGYPPVVANVSNNVGLVPGSAAAVAGYRRELRGNVRLALGLACASAAGAVGGGVLLLTLPASAFRAIVPVFIAVAIVVVIAQPWITAWVGARGRARSTRHRAAFITAVVLTGVYGGYFGAAQGVILLGILGLALRQSLQGVNAIKNVLAGTANLVAGAIFVVAAHVDWIAALLIACGSLAGGLLGATLARRLSPPLLRGVIVAVGTFAIVKLVA
jgi:uncharacterized membrane protein YfcA